MTETPQTFPADAPEPASDDQGMVEDAGNQAYADAPFADAGDEGEGSLQSGEVDLDDVDPGLTGTIRDPGADLDSAGVPAYAETYQPGDPDDPGPVPEPILETVPNPDAPAIGDDWGTTAEEQFQGEPLDLKLAREEPDVGAELWADPGADPGAAADPYDSATLDRVDEYDELDSERGVLVQPDEGTSADVEKDEVGTFVDRSEADLSAEEAAIHLEPER